MNQKIVNYLQQNKEQYHKNDLITELRKFGFGEEEIDEAVSEVYKQTIFGRVINTLMNNRLLVVLFLLFLYAMKVGVEIFVVHETVSISIVLAGICIFMIILKASIFDFGNNKKGMYHIVNLTYIACIILFFLIINVDSALVLYASSYDFGAYMGGLLMIIGLFFIAIALLLLLILFVIQIISNVRNHRSTFFLSKKTLAVILLICLFSGLKYFYFRETIVDSFHTYKYGYYYPYSDYNKKIAEKNKLIKEVCSKNFPANINFLGENFQIDIDSISTWHKSIIVPDNCEGIDTISYNHKGNKEIKTITILHLAAVGSAEKRIRKIKEKNFPYDPDIDMQIRLKNGLIRKTYASRVYYFPRDKNKVAIAYSPYSLRDNKTSAESKEIFQAMEELSYSNLFKQSK